MQRVTCSLLATLNRAAKRGWSRNSGAHVAKTLMFGVQMMFGLDLDGMRWGLHAIFFLNYYNYFINWLFIAHLSQSQSLSQCSFLTISLQYNSIYLCKALLNNTILYSLWKVRKVGAILSLSERPFHKVGPDRVQEFRQLAILPICRRVCAGMNEVVMGGT